MSENNIDSILLPGESEPHELSVKLKNVQNSYAEGGWPVRDRININCGNSTRPQTESYNEVNFDGRIMNKIDTADNWHSSSLTLKKGEIAVRYELGIEDTWAEICIAKENNVSPFSTGTERFPNIEEVKYFADWTFDRRIDSYREKLNILFNTSLNHNGIYRGKNLTNVYTPAQIKSKISNGFDDLYLGDYFDLTLSDNKKCRLEVAHFNYYKDRGIDNPHVVFIVGYTSDGYAGATTGTNGTAGKTTGYYNSTIHKTTLPTWVSKVETALGYSLTSFSERLSSAINTSINSMLRQPDGSSMTGCVSAMTWDTVKAILCVVEK